MLDVNRRTIKIAVLVMLLIVMTSCSNTPHKAMTETVDGILSEDIKSPERTESSSISYETWIANLYQDCVMAKYLVSDVQENKEAIVSFRTNDFCFFPKGYMSHGKDMAVDCAKKAAIGNCLDENMSKLTQLIFTEEMYMTVPESERGRKFSADTAYIHYGMNEIVGKIRFICEKGESELIE